MHSENVQAGENFLFKALVTNRAPVLVFQGRTYYAHQLLDEANTLAGKISDKVGRCPGPVAVVAGNEPAFVIALLSLWMAGRPAVLINSQTRRRELEKLLASSGSLGILTVSEGDAEFSEVSTGGTDDFVHTDMGPGVIQFSSGTSGKPKIVYRSAEGIFAEVQSLNSVLKIDATDRILAAVPLFHSYGLVTSLLTPLTFQATIHLLDQFYPRPAARTIDSYSISGFAAVPVMIRSLTQLTGDVSLKSLRYVLSAGAPLPEESSFAFEDRFGIRISGLYGTTETGVISLSCQNQKLADRTSVGMPIPGVEVSIQSAAGERMSHGTIGLVAIRSQAAASGYLCRSDLSSGWTGSRFIDGWFLPGDVGKFVPDLGLVLAGRAERLINISGVKIDPKEIEDVICEIPGVRESLVLEDRTSRKTPHLKAVVVSDGTVTGHDVVAWCASRVVPAKVPRVIEFLPELPRNALGKIQAKYLLSQATQENSGDHCWVSCLSSIQNAFELNPGLAPSNVFNGVRFLLSEKTGFSQFFTDLLGDRDVNFADLEGADLLELTLRVPFYVDARVLASAATAAGFGSVRGGEPTSGTVVREGGTSFSAFRVSTKEYGEPFTVTLIVSGDPCHGPDREGGTCDLTLTLAVASQAKLESLASVSGALVRKNGRVGLLTVADGIHLEFSLNHG